MRVAAGEEVRGRIWRAGGDMGLFILDCCMVYGLCWSRNYVAATSSDNTASGNLCYQTRSRLQRSYGLMYALCFVMQIEGYYVMYFC